MAMEFTIRKMCEADLGQVASIEAGAFTDWYRVHRRDPEPLPERTLDELRYATSIDPDANLVAVSAEGAMVGFILARSWGSVGWFGTFGVQTQFQGLGIGKALIACTVRHLKKSCSVIGLETMPESGANLGLYARMGFVVGYPTVIVESGLERSGEDSGGTEIVPWGPLGPGEREELLEGVRDIGDAILSGLDYTVAIEAMSRHGFGETFFATDGRRLDGFAVLRTAPFRKVDGQRHGYVHAMALRNGCDRERVLGGLLDRMRERASEAGRASLVAGVSGRYPEALDLLYSQGFRSKRASIRMIERPSSPEVFERSPQVNSSRWVG